MKSLRVLKQRYTFPEAAERAVAFDPPLVHADHNLFTRYAESSDRLTQIATGLNSICTRYLDFPIAVPTVEAFGAGAAALPYQETLEAMRTRLRRAIHELATALDVPQLGRIDWMDAESCHFTYFEVQKERGVFRNTLRRVAHQHDVVKARQHKLPADDVPMPKRGRQIVNAIPQLLIPYTRVITGLEVRKDVREESRRQEGTWLSQALASGKRQARQAARATGSGLAAVSSAIAAGVTGALSVASAPLAIADPAIVIGEVCLFGWES